MTFYANKYKNMYAPALEAMRGLRTSPAEERAAQEKASRSHMMGNLANVGLSLGGTAVGGLLGSLVAPGVGTAAGAGLGGALGAAPGAALLGSGGPGGGMGAGGSGVNQANTMDNILKGAGLGGQMGNQAGQAVSGLFAAQGEAALDPIRRKELQRQALMELLTRGV